MTWWGGGWFGKHKHLILGVLTLTSLSASFAVDRVRQSAPHLVVVGLMVLTAFFLVEAAINAWPNQETKIKRAIDALAVSALVVALYESHNAHKLMSSTQEVNGKTGELSRAMGDTLVKSEELARSTQAIADRMSTKSIGQFPATLKEIERLVAIEEGPLTVVADWAAYGHFSEPEVFERYFDHLSKRARKLTLYTYTAPVQRTELMEQFQLGKLNDGEFKTWLSSRWEPYRKFHDTTQAPSTPREFAELMVADDLDGEMQLRRRGARIVRVARKFPLFLWMNENECIFSFVTESGSSERALYTKDPQIMQTMREVLRDIERSSKGP